MVVRAFFFIKLGVIKYGGILLLFTDLLVIRSVIFTRTYIYVWNYYNKVDSNFL